MNEKEIRLELEKWRGYSAFEVAQQNGFNGTEKEWLDQLGAATNITVNDRQVDDSGNITLTAEHIMMVEEGQISIAQKVNNIGTETEERVTAAKNEIAAIANVKAQVLTQTAALPVDSWEQDGEIYGQSVGVTGVTIDKNKTSVIVSPPTDRAMEEEYLKCEVRASAQGDGILVFTCTDMPEVDIEANVMVVILGVNDSEMTDIHVGEGDGA